MTPAAEKSAIEARLGTAEFVKDILQYAALLESELDVCLAQYFCGPGKHLTFVDLIASRMRYEGKVQILESIELRRSLRSRVLALEGLRRIQKIRNLVAHPGLIPASKMENLQKDRVIVGMILGYPAVPREQFQATRRGLYHVTRSREWRHDSRAPAKINFYDVFLEKWRRNIYG